jgi:hypothetical protein
VADPMLADELRIAPRVALKVTDEAVQMFVFPGMVAASLCTFLVDRRIRRLSPDKSLERTRDG